MSPFPSLTLALVPCPLFQNDKIIQQPADFLMLIDNYMNAATSFIKQQAGEWPTPFSHWWHLQLQYPVCCV